MQTTALETNRELAPAGWLSAGIARVAGWAPIVVGLVFLYYGAGKVWELPPTAISINFFVHNMRVSYVLAIGVATMDVYFAFLLLTARQKRGPVIATICCLGMYAVFLCCLVAMEHPPSCGCGGMLKFFVSNRANAAVGLARNLGLMSYLGTYHYFFGGLKASASKAEG